MNTMEQALSDYLRIRHSLGFVLRITESSLRNFVSFCQASGDSYITTELALRWATQPTQVQPATWAWRLGMVRRFAIWHSASEPRTEIPPVGLLAHRYRRRPPHIYTNEEIVRLLRQTQQLPSPKGLRAYTYT
ncbi:MAG: integrase, partial [Thiobacillaceae bacterium]